MTYNNGIYKVMGIECEDYEEVYAILAGHIEDAIIQKKTNTEFQFLLLPKIRRQQQLLFHPFFNYCYWIFFALKGNDRTKQENCYERRFIDR